MLEVSGFYFSLCTCTTCYLMKTKWLAAENQFEVHLQQMHMTQGSSQSNGPTKITA